MRNAVIARKRIAPNEAIYWKKVGKFFVIAIGLILLFAFSTARAQTHVDLFGDTTPRAQRILSRFGEAVYRLALEEEWLETKYRRLPGALARKIHRKKARLREKIKRKGGYLYANYQLINYPENDARYVTIEVIRREQADRMDFLDKETTTPHRVQKDIIQTMLNYIDAGRRLLTLHQLDPRTINCTGYHCLFGFTHPELRPYKEKFDKAVIAEKNLILQTLRSDPDMQRRVASVYLIGEFRSPEEIIKRLNPYVDDKNSHVRNSVVRVIGDTMYRAQITDIDVRPFIHLLDSPYATDRNKALFVLFSAINNKESKRLIRKFAYEKLIALASLKQPNLHDFAIRILEQF